MALFLLSLIAISSTALAVPEKPVLPVANFTTNVISGYAPLSVQFTDNSILNEPNGSIPPRQQVITEGDNGKSISLKNGETFDLKLKENPSTGYSWELNLSQGLSILSDNYTQDPAPPGFTGVPGAHLWIVKAVTEGSQQVKGIYKRPTAEETGEESIFTLNVTDLSQNITSRNWEFGEGANSNEQNPTHTYSAPGTYTVNLTVSNENGKNSTFVTIAALEQPVPAYTIDKTIIDVAGKGPSGNVTKAGDVIRYQIKVPNDGNINLTNVRITDSLINLKEPIESKTPDGILEVGEIWTYTENYTVTQAKINSNGRGDGVIKNIATVYSDQLDPKSDIAEVPIRIGGGPYAYITNEYENTVSVIDTATNTVTATIPVGSNPIGVAVSPDGTKVYAANYYGKTVSVIDTATNTVIATVNVGSSPNGIAVSPDGTKVYVTNFHSVTVSVIDTATNTVTSTVDVGSAPRGVAVNPDGTKVYVANLYTGAVFVIDTATNTVTDVGVGNGPYGIAVSPDGTKVYVADEESNTVSVITTTTNNVMATVNVGSVPRGVAVSPDGTKVYVANEGSNNVSVIDTVTNGVMDTVNVGINPHGVAVTPDGTKVYVANYHSNNVSVIDTATNKVTATVNVGNGPVAFGQSIGIKQIPIGENPVLLVAAFSACPVSGKAPLKVKFTDKSTGSPTSWHWNFGDNCTSTTQNPVHKYCKRGGYTVSLKVKNAAGCDIVKKTRYVILKN
ncbi:MAG: PKD domain-containing protein [Methanosarcina sp.]